MANVGGMFKSLGKALQAGSKDLTGNDGSDNGDDDGSKTSTKKKVSPPSIGTKVGNIAKKVGTKAVGMMKKGKGKGGHKTLDI